MWSLISLWPLVTPYQFPRPEGESLSWDSFFVLLVHASSCGTAFECSLTNARGGRMENSPLVRWNFKFQSPSLVDLLPFTFQCPLRQLLHVSCPGVMVPPTGSNSGVHLLHLSWSQKMHPFKVNNSMILSKFAELCKYHHFQKISITPKRSVVQSLSIRTLHSHSQPQD